jgi:outer membrane protein
MKTFLALTLASACGAAFAQSPAANPMPDGSRDMYVGLGVVSAPEYAGASARRTALQPLIQMEWSNGIFVSGLSAGMHLSRQPTLEFGPLISLHSGRDKDGDNGGAGGISDTFPGLVDPGRVTGSGVTLRAEPNGLAGMDDIKARLQGGAFLNYYLTPSVRLTSSLLYGAGNARDGLVLNLGVQRLAFNAGPHHRVSLVAGASIVNRSYNSAFFGVTDPEARASGYSLYAPEGGVKDVYVGAAWNWALSRSWMVTSGARVTGLVGDARRSPLVQRSTNVSVSTGLAYRF